MANESSFASRLCVENKIVKLGRKKASLNNVTEDGVHKLRGNAPGTGYGYSKVFGDIRVEVYYTVNIIRLRGGIPRGGVSHRK